MEERSIEEETDLILKKIFKRLSQATYVEEDVKQIKKDVREIKNMLKKLKTTSVSECVIS